MLITTRRFAIRDFTPSDARGFLAYHADPRFRARMGEAAARAPQPQALLDDFALWAAEKPRVNYQLAVVRRDTEALVGCCGLRDVRQRAELGVEIAPDFWGSHGTAIEIVGALVAFGFGSLELHEIYGLTTASNFGAARLASWFGAVEISRGPRSGPIGGRGADAPVEWCITRGAWMERRETAERPAQLI